MMIQTNLFDVADVVATHPALGSYAEAVGCGVYHKGQHGTIVAYDTETYAEPMFVVSFDGRIAVLKPSELGAS